MRALITTFPFAKYDITPITLLKESGINYVINPIGRKFTEDELALIIHDYDILIAGTEIISKKVIDCAKSLKLISRVGVGLDGVDLNFAREKDIAVSYTPDAPAPAVAELALGLTFNLLRSIQAANNELHQGIWNRHFGKRISETKFGIIGVGRIGKIFLSHLINLGAKDIYLNDSAIEDNGEISFEKCHWRTKEDIYRECDVISLHVPLTSKTRNLITLEQMALMRSNTLLINTARGGIVNENDLYHALLNKIIGGAAVDVFEQEPYYGNLKEINSCILTSHMGSMAEDCRARMEIEAVDEAVRFVKNIALINPVPEHEYDMQKISNE